MRSAGHDVATVLDQHLSGADDSQLANICKGQERILVTIDVGFADIRTYPPGEHAGIIVLRLRRQDKPHVLSVLDRLTAIFESQNVSGRLWVVEDKRIRIRE